MGKNRVENATRYPCSPFFQRRQTFPLAPFTQLRIRYPEEKTGEIESIKVSVGIQKFGYLGILPHLTKRVSHHNPHTGAIFEGTARSRSCQMVNMMVDGQMAKHS